MIDSPHPIPRIGDKQETGDSFHRLRNRWWISMPLDCRYSSGQLFITLLGKLQIAVVLLQAVMGGINILTILFGHPVISAYNSIHKFFVIL